MHKLLIIFCMFIASSYFVFALEYDVIHLKDGNAIQGIIIEIIANKSVKIKVGKEICTYQMNDIDNISFATRQDNSYLSSETSGIRYKGIFEAGSASNVTDEGNSHLKVNLINGINFNNLFSLGFGIGINSYNSFKYNYVPIFIDLRIPFWGKKPTAFFILDGGYTIWDLYSHIGKYKNFFNFGIGCNYKIYQHLGIDFSLTYDINYYKYASGYNTYNLYNISHYSYNVSGSSRCISFNMGIDF
jgi:hypothetical protein